MMIAKLMLKGKGKVNVWCGPLWAKRRALGARTRRSEVTTPPSGASAAPP